MTFGSVVRRARLARRLPQMDLARMILKEDGTPISAQYLNDLERDRRNPPGPFLRDQFARILEIPADYLYYLSGELPPDLCGAAPRPEQVVRAFDLLRTELRAS